MENGAATTAEQFLAGLPDDRREMMRNVLELVRRKMPKGYQEIMYCGMPTWVIPLEKYPRTHNGQALSYLALAAQKNHCALYMMGVYMDPEADARLRAAYGAAGKKLDMGKSCLRFRKLEDLELDAVAKSVASIPPKRYIELYEAVQARTNPSPKKKRA
jgi:uncharacterized protein YdhG (YjbR/CyaY superfamily)